MSQPQPPADAAVPARRPRGRQTGLDMVRSMVVILALVLLILLLAPQPGEVEQPQVGGTEAATAVAGAAEALGAAPLLLRPGTAEEAPDGAEVEAEVEAASAVVPLGDGWRLDYVRTEEVEDVLTWRLGVLSPGERRVALEQAVDPGEEWLTRADDGRVGLPEPVVVQGVTWTRQSRGSGGTTYTHVAEPTATGEPALTTALTATSDSEDLQHVVGLVSQALTG